MRELKNRPKEYWALIYAKDQVNTNLAIFIHGFRGSYLTTWGKLSDLLKVHADSHPTFKSWDYLFLGYDTRRIETYLDISARISTEWKKAETGSQPFSHSYQKLALFGHSLGTLGIRQLLCAWSVQSTGMMQAMHSIALFGTPLNGSPLARLALPLGYPIAAALGPKNAQLRMLRTWVESSYGKQPWPKAKVILGQADDVVGHESAELVDWPGDDTPDITTFNHSSMVKPDTWDNSAVIDYIARALL